MASALAFAVTQCSPQTQRQGTLEDLDDCVRSFCGCWTEVTFDYQATVVDRRRMPIVGAELTCMGEDTVIARSSASGLLAFTIETEESPGCGLARCGNLLVEDSMGRSMEAIASASNGDTIVLHHATIQSP